MQLLLFFILLVVTVTQAKPEAGYSYTTQAPVFKNDNNFQSGNQFSYTTAAPVFKSNNLQLENGFSYTTAAPSVNLNNGNNFVNDIGKTHVQVQEYTYTTAAPLTHVHSNIGNNFLNGNAGLQSNALNFQTNGLNLQSAGLNLGNNNFGSGLTYTTAAPVTITENAGLNLNLLHSGGFNLQNNGFGSGLTYTTAAPLTVTENAGLNLNLQSGGFNNLQNANFGSGLTYTTAAPVTITENTGFNLNSLGSNVGNGLSFGNTGFSNSFSFGQNVNQKANIETSKISTQSVDVDSDSVSIGSAVDNGPEVVTEGPVTVFKHVYLHVAPPEPEEVKPHKPIVVPAPQKHYKIIFIKAPTAPTPTAPSIPVFPQNEEKTLVYVLVKKPEEAPQIKLAAPPTTPPSKPDVYFIRYKTQKEAANAISSINSAVNAVNTGSASADALTNLQGLNIQSSLTGNNIQEEIKSAAPISINSASSGVSFPQISSNGISGQLNGIGSQLNGLSNQLTGFSINKQSLPTTQTSQFSVDLQSTPVPITADLVRSQNFDSHDEPSLQVSLNEESSGTSYSTTAATKTKPFDKYGPPERK